MFSSAIVRVRASAGVIRAATLPSLLGLITLAAACSPKRAAAVVDAGTDAAAATGLTLSVAGGLLRVEVCAADVIRVAFASDAAFFTRATAMTAPKHCDATPFTQASDGSQTTITTARLTVRADETTGAVTFLDPSGAVVLAETSDGHAVTPATVQGEATNNVRQQWVPIDGESLYGLGQHQQGLIDIKDTDLDLHQYNTEVFVPFLVSSNGYGLLWDNTSRTRFGDLTPAVPLPVADSTFYATGGEVGDVAPGTGVVDWTGPVTAPADGDYTFRTYSSGTIQLSIDDQLVIDHWRQGWQPNEDLAHVSLTAGQTVMVHLHWSVDTDFPATRIVRLLWKPPVANRTTSLWSEVGDGVDYWFAYGPELDQVVAGYRRLTGQAPMMPRWAYGFWQSRDHYQSAQDLTDVLTGYRSRGAPIDNIVQDWQYWPTGTWGSHQFDPTRYPDPVGLIQSIHSDYHAHLMISVWPKFYPPGPILDGSGNTFSADNYVALNAIGAVFQPNITEGKKDFLGYPFTFYDAFNPAARQLYWSQINDALFSKAIDAWWMDATEPEIVEGPFTSGDVEVETNQTHMTPTAAGSGARVLNAFSLMNSQAIYEGQRATTPNAQRVFILTRNGFAGQQRYAATTWSGDVSSTWTAMRKQIPAGLSFSLSGIPYWTLDSGGYAVPPFAVTAPTATNPDAADEWYEMNTRWFEYATFLPIMRVHGQAPPREIWQFGGDGSPAYAAMLKFDELRYRLLPYIYSLAGGVTQQAGTILRPLVMDFRGDATARAIGDQYMFGPALMIAPVTTYQARTLSVYLPPSAGWYDFWTGTFQNGAGTGLTVNAAADFDAMPVFVRAGSILPLGPDLQYSDEKTPDPITLYVYSGADGAFTLYEDDGTTYGYESGAFATIAITWSDAIRQLTIGARSGSFPGMLAQRRFEVVVVDPTKPVGYAEAPMIDQEIVYSGDATAASL